MNNVLQVLQNLSPTDRALLLKYKGCTTSDELSDVLYKSFNMKGDDRFVSLETNEKLEQLLRKYASQLGGGVVEKHFTD